MFEQKLGHRTPPADVKIGLAEALEKNWLEFWYQPKIDLRKKQLAGAEAFARVRHPQHGVLPPSAFMPGADEAALVSLAEQGTGERAQVRAELSRLGVNLRIAVNVSITALVKLPVGDIVRDLSPADHNWPGLIFDLAEEQIVNEIGLANEMTQELAEHNVKLAIDDFGKGYAALMKLKELPFVEMKLDRVVCHRLRHRQGACADLQDRDRPRPQLRQPGGRHRPGERRRRHGAAQHGLRSRPGLPARPADAGGALHRDCCGSA